MGVKRAPIRDDMYWALMDPGTAFGTIVMRKEFLRYLAEQNALPLDRAARFSETLERTAEPFGTIAFHYGLLTGDDIDAILDEQRWEYRPFGEIAVSKGLLTSKHVEILLQIQQIRAAVEMAEALALAGLCPLEQVVAHLGRFLADAQKVACVSR